MEEDDADAAAAATAKGGGRAERRRSPCPIALRVRRERHLSSRAGRPSALSAPDEDGGGGSPACSASFARPAGTDLTPLGTYLRASSPSKTFSLQPVRPVLPLPGPQAHTQPLGRDNHRSEHPALPREAAGASTGPPKRPGVHPGVVLPAPAKPEGHCRDAGPNVAGTRMMQAQ